MATFLSFFLPLLMLLTACSDPGAGTVQALNNNDNTNETTTEAEDLSEPDTTSLAKATFAGGCFWCTEAIFERLKGVKHVVSGYTGGKELNPTYQQVSAGKTGHAEAVQVYFNPKEISYAELLEVFFATHDPTTLNRQGPDVGKQYRSVIFYHDAQQQQQAKRYIVELDAAGTYKNKIVTQLVPFTKFWEAEDYHQDYYRLNPTDPYVVSVARPKIKKFEDAFRSKLKSN
ncbi:peptide-methionine (S)-S-oxide reductase MsrA [Pontibacter vulgaris]|uniref:peptide-methionine (S)-S-oxide reductase MsrA n=1 Tax=Pontibacter vulgaris TaxID=2905679 RepID=UPI001FA741ED|nr:peptide-methionine (S)-S-oxide reductase MsrA [Pontibacter vulgaris]